VAGYVGGVTFSEHPLLFPCGGEELVGVLARPRADAADVGVVIVVGGPQYRAGSHRQFVLLARWLASEGFPCLRFDYRGMGDSTGAPRAFDTVDADVRAAVDRLVEQMPSIRRIVLWGLCDGASAACFYAPTDPRVSGVILVNPWVRTESGEAKVMLKHYYGKRLLDPQFWKKLMAGGVTVGKSIRELVGAAGNTVAGRRGAGAPATSTRLPDRMAGALATRSVPFALVLSGCDYVAREFEDALAGHAWRALAQGRQCLGIERLPGADHTFSNSAARQALETLSSQLVARIAGAGSGDR
jgi:exosortase A-associated hydrolase 1